MILSWPYKLLIAVGFTLMAFGYGYYTGDGACKNRQLKETIKVVEKVRYVRQKTDAMPSGAVFDSLRKWER